MFAQDSSEGFRHNRKPGDCVLSARNITLFYGKRKVLDNISLLVKLGEIVTILGPNGGGKTSLVRVLVGINRNYSGLVKYAEKVIVGYLPQGFRINNLIPMTVECFLLNSFFGEDKVSSLGRVLEYVDISRLLMQQISEISAGEVQLVLLTRCLMMQPDLLILDEPVSFMDVSSRGRFYQLIERLASVNHMGVVMTSHDLHRVVSCSDRVVCVNHSVSCEGTPAEVTESADFEHVFR